METDTDIYRKHKEYVYNTRITRSFDLLKNEKINRFLDIGCVDGGFLALFPKSVKKYGVDIIKRENIRPDIIFKKCDISQGLPFENDFFDAIFTGETIEHVLDTDFFISECYRVLKKGGVLVLTTPNTVSFDNLIMWFFKKQLINIDYAMNQQGHVRYYSPQAIKDQLTKHNFKVKKIWSGSCFIPFVERFIPKSLQKPIQKIIDVITFPFGQRGGCLVVKAIKVISVNRLIE